MKKPEYQKLIKTTPHYHKGMYTGTSLIYDVGGGNLIHTTSGNMGCLTEDERAAGCIAFEVWPPWMKVVVVKDK